MGFQGCSRKSTIEDWYCGHQTYRDTPPTPQHLIILSPNALKLPFPTLYYRLPPVDFLCQSSGHRVTPRNMNPRQGSGITLKPHTITTLYAALIKRLEVFLVPHSKSIYRIPGVNGLLRVTLLLGVSISRNYLAFSHCCFHREIALDLQAPGQTGQQCSSLQTLTGGRVAQHGLMKLVNVQCF